MGTVNWIGIQIQFSMETHCFKNIASKNPFQLHQQVLRAVLKRFNTSSANYSRMKRISQNTKHDN